MALLHVKVVPNSSCTRTAGHYADALKITVAATPRRGQASDAVMTVLAGLLHLESSGILLVSGHTQPRKTFSIPTLQQDRLGTLIHQLLQSLLSK